MKLKKFIPVASIVAGATPVMAQNTIYICQSCEAGKYSDGTFTQCQDCPAGTYSSSGASSCKPCPSGTFATGGASECKSCLTTGVKTCDSKTGKATSCNAGYGFNINGSCTACEAGKYSAGGTAGCSYCSTGTYSSAEGASSCSPCAGAIYGSYNAQCGSTTRNMTSYCSSIGSKSPTENPRTTTVSADAGSCASGQTCRSGTCCADKPANSYWTNGCYFSCSEYYENVDGKCVLYGCLQHCGNSLGGSGSDTWVNKTKSQCSGSIGGGSYDGVSSGCNYTWKKR